MSFTKGLPAYVYQQKCYVDNLNMDKLRSYLLDMELKEASSKNTREETTLVVRGSISSNGPFGGALWDSRTPRNRQLEAGWWTIGTRTALEKLGAKPQYEPGTP